MDAQKPTENETPPSPADSVQPGADTGASLPSYEFEREEGRTKKAAKKILRHPATIFALTALAALGIALVAPPIYKAAKGWRAMQFVKQAEAADAAGKTTEAVDFLRKAFLLAPDDDRVLRPIYSRNAEAGDPSARRALEKMIENGKVGPTEIASLFAACVASGEWDAAQKALQKLPVKVPEPLARKVAINRIRLLLGTGKRNEAIETARIESAERKGIEGDPIRLLFAQILCMQNTANDPAPLPDEAVQVLKQVGDHPSDEGILALQTLANLVLQRAKDNKALAREVSTLLSNHPKTEIREKLLAVDLDIAAEPSDREVILDRVTKMAEGATRNEKVEIARWLTRRGANEAAVTVTGEDKTDADLVMVRLDALTAMGRWDEAAEILRGGGITGMEDAIRHLFLVRTAMEANKPDQIEAEWREVLNQLRYCRPEIVRYVARYAEQIGAKEQAYKAYKVLSELPDTGVEGYLGVIRCIPKNVPTSELLASYDSLLDKFPDFVEAQSDRAFLQLLTGTSVSTAAATARRLAEKEPNLLSFLAVAALGDLLEGNATAADARFQDRPIEWSKAIPSWVAVRIAVLKAVGKTAEAVALESQLDRSQLRPEEISLISR